MLIVSFLALAIVCVYYKEAEFSFHMYIAHIVRSLWVEAISNHGLQPTEIRLYSIITSLATTSIFCLLYFKSLSINQIMSMIGGCGVKLAKIARTSTEIERKIFHLSGLTVPFLYQYLIRFHQWNQQQYVIFCIICTSVIWIGDLMRLHIPATKNFFPFNVMTKILREKEKDQLSGTCYFSLGCTLAIAIFPPAVSTLSVIWLVLGDMSAALIGVSFGGETVALKMGREGKKSVEGSVAMFITCTVIGFIVFMKTNLAEYAVVVGALVATLVELYEPFGLNDNITIPVSSCIALQWALSRIQTCR